LDGSFLRSHQQVLSGRFCWNNLALIATASFFASEEIDFIVKSGSYVGEPFQPGVRPFLWVKHFHVILMTKQALGERAVETPRYSRLREFQGVRDE